jgi:prostaglandin-H2 D-isomerase / glutathione transferase
MYVDQVTDFLNQLVKVHYETDEVKKAELAAKLQTEVIPTHMKIFETKLTQTNTGHLVGASLTLADIYLFAILDSTAEKSAAILEHFPSVKKLAETVKAMPHVAKWLESRPVTAM